MQKFPNPVLLLALLIGALAGCTDVGRLVSTGLKGELTSIVCAADGTATASWHVSNPNIVPYLFSRVSSKVYLNGIYVGMMVNDSPLGVPANSEVSRSGKITGGDAAAGQALAAALAHGSANYRVETQLIILIYGDSTEKGSLTGSGVVPVTAQ